MVFHCKPSILGTQMTMETLHLWGISPLPPLTASLCPNFQASARAQAQRVSADEPLGGAPRISGSRGVAEVFRLNSDGFIMLYPDDLSLYNMNHDYIWIYPDESQFS